MSRTIVQPTEGSGGIRKQIKKFHNAAVKKTKKPKAPKPSGNGGNAGKPSNSSGLGRKGGNQNVMYGAMGDYPGVRYGDALSIVNAGLKPEINQVRNDRQQLRRETQAERQRAKRFYNSQVGDINHIYDETGEYVNQQNQAITQNYQGLQDRTAQAQQALLTHMESAGAQNYAGASSELDRLGIAQGGGMDRFSADQGFLEGQANINGMNNQANIAAMQSGASDVGNLLSGMVAGSRASNLGQAANTKANSLFETETAKRTAVEQLKRSMKDLRAQRPDLVRQMLEQMQQSRWGQYMDMQNLDLQEEQLDLQRAAQRAYNKRSSSYSSSGYDSGGSSSSGTYSSGGAGSATGDGGKSGGSTPGGGAYSDLILQVLQGKKPKPKPKPRNKK